MLATRDGAMMQEYYLGRLRRLAAARDARLASLRTPTDARRYQQRVREQLRTIFGPFPQRTPLNAQVRGLVERPTYILERLVLESRPGFFISANLYRPHRPGPHPAVLGACGHSEEGKAYPPYRTFVRALAEQGYVAMLFDPVGQGERHQCASAPTRRRPRGCVREHLMIGKQLSLVGEFLGTWMIWDAIRCLDYLFARPEVDPTRVGITGNSGGGTLATHLAPFEPRITMAASSCFVTTYLANLENELPADNEQYPPGILGRGLDLADFWIAFAPRPVILLGQEQDFFDVRGLRDAYEQVRRVYRLLGAEDRVALHIGPGGHGYHADARSAMYRFFGRFSGTRGQSERSVPLEAERDLHAAPAGQVRRLPGHREAVSITRSLADQLSPNRRQSNRRTLTRILTRCLELPKRAGVPHYRSLRPIEQSPSERYPKVWPFVVETEPGIRVGLSAWLRRDRRKARWYAHPPVLAAATLYVPHLSVEADLQDDALPVRPAVLLAVEPRGVGRSAPATGHPELDLLDDLGADFLYAAHGLMLGESVIGRRVHDVLAVLDLMADRGTKRVHLVGRGLGAITATFAGCLHPLVHRVTLRHAPRSYRDMLEADVTAWPMSCMPWGVLRHFDLPDCYRLLLTIEYSRKHLIFRRSFRV